LSQRIGHRLRIINCIVQSRHAAVVVVTDDQRKAAAVIGSNLGLGLLTFGTLALERYLAFFFLKSSAFFFQLRSSTLIFQSLGFGC
jgi:hypothetical protein